MVNVDMFFRSILTDILDYIFRFFQTLDGSVNFTRKTFNNEESFLKKCDNVIG